MCLIIANIFAQKKILVAYNFPPLFSPIQCLPGGMKGLRACPQAGFFRTPFCHTPLFFVIVHTYLHWQNFCPLVFILSYHLQRFKCAAVAAPTHSCHPLRHNEQPPLLPPPPPLPSLLPLPLPLPQPPPPPLPSSSPSHRRRRLRRHIFFTVF